MSVTSTAAVSVPRRSTRLRVVPIVPPAPRCPVCRGELDRWELELARIDLRPADCRSCGAVLV
jgi:hypothetical protein